MAKKLTSHKPRRPVTRKQVWRDALIGLSVAGALVAAKTVVEQFGFCQVLDIYGHSLIQHGLRSTADGPAPEVVVVDLYGLKEATPMGAALEPSIDFTPRTQLWEVVRAVADHGARAIGIDVDFSKDDRGMNPPGSEDFLAKALDLSATVPVVLGVDRHKDDSESNWLWVSDYSNLAAGITFVTPRDGFPDYTQVPLWRKSENASRELPGFGAKLGAYVPGAPQSYPKNSWFAEAVTTLADPRKGIEVARFTINTGVLGRLSDRVISYREALSPTGRAKVENKIVILGDVSEASDQFSLWGFWRDPIPGVLLHACAALTRGTGLFYRPSHLGRLALDFGFAMVVLAGVVVIRLAMMNRPDPHAVHRMVTLIAVAVVIGGGYYLAIATRLLWTDFILVGIALMMHSPIEQALLGLFRTVSSCLSGKPSGMHHP